MNDEQKKIQIRAIDKSVANVVTVCLTPGFLMIMVGFIGFDSNLRLSLSLVVGILTSVLLWFALSHGTYITINSNKDLYGTVLFIRGRKTSLYQVVSLSTRGAFIGGMTDVYLTFRNEKGVLVTRGLVSKTALKKEDLRKLIDAICIANPNIEVPEVLLR